MIRWFVGTVAMGLVPLGFWQILYTHSVYPDDLMARVDASWWGALLCFIGIVTLFLLTADWIRRQA